MADAQGVGRERGWDSTQGDGEPVALCEPNDAWLLVGCHGRWDCGAHDGGQAGNAGVDLLV
jgi:hypothetical protein